MIVLESARDLRPTRSWMRFNPYFAGASLGWHDYLASTARLFKEDGNYGFPSKRIRTSSSNTSKRASTRGGRRGFARWHQVGGMYGILPLAGSAESLQITLKGFIRDVVTQMSAISWILGRRIPILCVLDSRWSRWRRRVAGESCAFAKMIEGLLDKAHAQDVRKLLMART